MPVLRDRHLDVGYRARKVPAWLGSFGQEKWLIAERFRADADQYGLTCDFSTREEDRIYGEDWINFLVNCKAVLGTESGASICDFTGEIQRTVESHVSVNPDASFETLRDLYFKDEDGRIILSVISPRCFEAAALRTLMILYEGSYSGRLQPWRHYVPLNKDHSNMTEIVEVIRDQARAQAIVDTAFSEVALNPDNSFAAMVRQVDGALNRVFCEAMAARKGPYRDTDLTSILRWGRRRERVRIMRAKAGILARASLRPRSYVKAYSLARRKAKLVVIRTMWHVSAYAPP